MRRGEADEMSHHILVVEDDEMIQSFLSLHLEHEGYRVSAVSTGKEMLAAFEAEDIDLILLDLNLPDQNGLSLAETIRETSAVPIIIATATKEQLTKLTAFNLGANDYVTKPYDPLELMARIRSILGTPGPIAQMKPASTHGLSEHQKSEPKPDPVQNIAQQKRRTKIYGAIAAVSLAGLLILIAYTVSPNIFGGGADLAAKKQSPKADRQQPQNAPTLTGSRNYEWVAKANCPQIPDVPWWINKTHLQIAKVVDSQFKRNWRSYMNFWENEKDKLIGIKNRGNRAVVNKDISLEGVELEAYINNIDVRLSILRCLSRAPKR